MQKLSLANLKKKKKRVLRILTKTHCICMGDSFVSLKFTRQNEIVKEGSIGFTSMD
jgi:hypothetical protein